MIALDLQCHRPGNPAEAPDTDFAIENPEYPPVTISGIDKEEVDAEFFELAGLTAEQ